MIYSRFGEVITIVRVGTVEDVKTFEKRKPDKDDRHNVSIGNYVVVKFPDGREMLHSISYMKADDGFREIADAIKSADPAWVGAR